MVCFWTWAVGLGHGTLSALWERLPLQLRGLPGNAVGWGGFSEGAQA